MERREGMVEVEPKRDRSDSAGASGDGSVKKRRTEVPTEDATAGGDHGDVDGDGENTGDTPPELVITLREIESPDDKELPMRLNRYIKYILKLWEESPSGLLLDTKKALFPMLVKLRKNTLPVDHLTSLMTIFYHLQRAEYMKANESYMKLSIGNVAWPIGVISISIHARSTQSRLAGGKANIMLDEQTRKWITGVKRLITFMEQRQYETTTSGS